MKTKLFLLLLLSGGLLGGAGLTLNGCCRGRGTTVIVETPRSKTEYRNGRRGPTIEINPRHKHRRPRNNPRYRFEFGR